MPIDFAAVAALFSAQLAEQARRSLLSQKGILKVLVKRRDAARAVELATRMFPVIRFEEGAVAMTLASTQRGLLELTTPPLSFGDQLAAGATSFVDGVANAAAPFRSDSQEGAIGRFARSFDGALSDLIASIRRFEVPTREMFDPRDKSAGDVVGLAALAWRTLVEASQEGGDIERFTGQLGRALKIFRAPDPDDDPAQPPKPERSLGEMADGFTAWMLGGTVILGVLPELIGDLLSAAWFRVRAMVLDQFMGIERTVLDLRAAILRKAVEGLVAWADKAIDVVTAVEQIVAQNIAFMLRFWRRIGTAFVTGVKDFLIGLGEFLLGVVEIMKALPAAIAGLTSFDLSRLVDSATKEFGIHLVTGGSVTLDMLLDADGRRVNASKAARLSLDLDAAQWLADKLRKEAWPFFGGKFDKADRAIGRARRLVGLLFPGWKTGGNVVDVPPEAPPLRFTSNFPNLYETLFGGGRAARVLGFVDRLRATAELGVSETMRRARDGIGRLGTEFDRAGRQAAQLGSSAEYERIRTGATAVADRVFGPEVQRARDSLSEPSALARALEGWLAGGGFELTGQAIPAYVAELGRHWREEVEHGEEPTALLTPTSPHILRQHATLGRVALPRLTMHVPAGRTLDADLAEEVAARFALQMRDAYGTGQRRLAELAAAPGP